MEDDLGPAPVHGGGQRLAVADVGPDVLDQQVLDPAGYEVARARGRGQCETTDLGAQPLQPDGQPRALETGVPGDQDPPLTEGVGEHGSAPAQDVL